MNEKNDFNSVHHIHIKSRRAMINCMNYFPYTTKLTFSDRFNIMCDSIGSELTRIIPLKQITVLIFDYKFPSLKQLVQLLGFLVNIHTLKLTSLSLTENDSTTIRQSEIFQLVSRTNTIQSMILEGESLLDHIQLLTALCPRLQHVTVCGFSTAFALFVQLMYSKNNNDTRHLSSMCVSKMDEVLENNLKCLLKREQPRGKFLAKFVNGKLYLWW
jgi:hypothetical protein